MKRSSVWGRGRSGGQAWLLGVGEDFRLHSEGVRGH